MRRTADYFMQDDRSNDGQQETEADHLRYEIARVTEWAATFGGHPEQAPVVERELCAVAGLPQPPPERDTHTQDLFAA